MEYRVSVPRLAARLAAASLVVAAVAGCRAGENAGSVLNIGRANPVDVQAAQAQIDAAELRAYCPRVSLPSNASVLNRYAPKGEGDATKLVYQASVADVTRACTYNQGTMGITVAIAGRVVPGAAATGGAVTVPIKIEVIQSDGQMLYSQIHQHQVQIGADSTQFVFSDPSIVIPQPTARNVLVTAGFDVPPPPKDEI